MFFRNSARRAPALTRPAAPRGTAARRCAIYFFGDKAQIPFRIVYCIAIPVGVLTQLDVVWLLADTCNALMAIPNLIAILLLSPVLFKLVKEDESKDSIFKH